MKQLPIVSPPEPPVRQRTPHVERPMERPHTPAAVPQHTIDRRTGSLITSFKHAFAGVWHLFITQRNAQIHALITACAVALGWALGLERWEWLVLVLTVALVLAAEAFNTAAEAVVDLVTTTYHPLARVAKDVAAGAVVLCALAAVVVGCILFVPHLWPMLTGMLEAQ